MLSHLDIAHMKDHQNILGIGPSLSFLDKITAKNRAALVPEAFYEPAPRDYAVTSFSEKNGLPLKNAFFDYIFMMHTLEYLPYPCSFLRDVWRALKPDGRLTVFLPNRTPPFQGAGNLPPSQVYTAKQLEQVFEESFFTVSLKKTFLFPPSQWITYAPLGCKILEKILEVLPITYGGNMVMVNAQKDAFKTSQTPSFVWQRA